MTTPTTNQTILQQFSRFGKIRQAPSIFGQPIGLSTADKTVHAFTSAGLTHQEPNIFGASAASFNGQPVVKLKLVERGSIFAWPTLACALRSKAA